MGAAFSALNLRPVASALSQRLTSSAPEFAGFITPDHGALILLTCGAQTLQQLVWIYICDRSAGLGPHLSVIRDT